MPDMSRLQALSVVIAASASALFITPAIAQTEIQTERFIDIPILDSSPTLLNSGFGAELPVSLPAEDSASINARSTRSTLIDETLIDRPVIGSTVLPTNASSGLASPSIEVRAANPGTPVILIDPVEQSYLNLWEQTATTQLSDINIRSAVQAPITRTRIRAGRPVVERLGRDVTDRFVSTTLPSSNVVFNLQSHTRQPALSALPDGNYRLLLSSRGIDSDGLVTEGRLFTFRKSADRVTGNFNYVGSGESACVTGTVQGSTVFGEAFTNSSGIRVLDRTYLGSGLSLQLSDDFNDKSAVLNLNGFALINAGTVAPPVTCQ